MQKASLKKMLDYIPLLILVVLTIILFINCIVNGFVLRWRNIAGVILLLINGYLFYRHHKLGVLCTGFILLAGLIGLISFHYALVNISFSLGFDDNRLTIFRGNPIYFLWITVHLVVSARYYFAIGTKKYWNEIGAELKSYKTKTGSVPSNGNQ